MIKVKVKPNSKEEKITKTPEGYVVNVKESPEKNKANKALIKLLSKYFKKRIKIKSGFNSREKMIEM